MQKGSKDFDDIFKNKLSSLSADSNPSDWIMMERLLEMEGLTPENEATDETRFDEVAIDKLNNIPTTALTPDWSRMSSMIDEMNEEPSMESSEFDQAIDNQLKDAALPLEMMAWNRLEPVLDKDRESLVAELDDVTRGKLTQISEIESAWGSMNSKINRELFLPESIVKYKVIEVALILLFGFSALQLPIGNNAEEVTNTASSTKIESTEALPSVEADVATTDLPLKTITEEVTAIPAQNISAPLVSNEVSIPEEEFNKDVLPSTENVIETVSSSIVDEPIWDLPPTIVEVLDDLSKGPSFNFTPQAYAYIFNVKNDPEFEDAQQFLDLYDEQMVANVFGSGSANFDSGLISESNTQLLASTLLDSGEIPSLSQSIQPYPIVAVPNANSYPSRSGLILSLFTGSDYNEIVTPFDPVYAKEGTQQWNVGYGGGVALGMRFKNWELETGAIYASNQYQPRKLYEINSGSISTGYIASTLRDIELEIVKVPLNFRFNVNLWDKWKVYALSGATMNMVIQSEFITDDVFIGKGSFATPANAVAPASVSSRLAQKDFGEGILEGGSFKDNSFFTANLGFGVERSLNTKWSVFAQPTYQRQIFSNGIGPNQDRYNAISLFLGTRVALSKRVKK